MSFGRWWRRVRGVSEMVGWGGSSGRWRGEERVISNIVCVRWYQTGEKYFI